MQELDAHLNVACEEWLASLALPRGDKRVLAMARTFPRLLRWAGEPDDPGTELQWVARRAIGAVSAFAFSDISQERERVQRMAEKLSELRVALDLNRHDLEL